MPPPFAGPNSAGSNPTFNHSTSRHYWDRDAPSQFSAQPARAHSEHSSDTSTNSSRSFDCPKASNMNRGRGSPQRRARGGRGGYRGGRGGFRTNSSSSGSSGDSIRPVFNKNTLNSWNNASPATNGDHGRARADSPMTPTMREQSSVALNGHIINETYKPTGSASPTPMRNHASPPAPTRNTYGGGSPGRQHGLQRPVTRGGENNWVHHQEYKIRIRGLPPSSWTQDVHAAMSRYGNVVRIEMHTNGRNLGAAVVFQPPPKQNLPRRLAFGPTSVNWDSLDAQVRTVPSPVDRTRHYSEFNIIFANSLDFGVRDDNSSMIAMHTVATQAQVQLMLNLDRKELDIQFPLALDGKTRMFRFRLPFALLAHIYKSTNRPKNQTSLIIPFEAPPQFFIQMYEGEKLPGSQTHTSHSPKERNWISWNTWNRETDVVTARLKQSLRNTPLMNHKDKAMIDIGRWTSYKLSFDGKVFAQPQFREFAQALADHGIVIEDHDDYIVKDRTNSPLWTLLEEEIAGTHPHLEPATETNIFDSLSDARIHLPFPVRYQLEACISNGCLQEHNMGIEFIDKLATLEPRRALYILEKVMDKQRTYYDPMDIFKIRVKGALEKKVPGYCILQRSAIITPTMIHVASPIMETSNRITRKYAADADHFIRIKFSDEKTEGVLRSMPNNRADAVFDRVRRAMKNGIVVAGRYYEFLAFGNSQFREHGAYFYAPTSSKSADDIRLSLGNFDHIRTVAKFGARLGQCFSTTRAMRTTVSIVKIHDIERNGYCFTDGVGKLSLFVAQMAAQELGLANAFDDPPSLYQFRLGGCKGVLALDPKIIGSEVHIRASQLKFEATYNGLEIIRSSALATPFFNRQIIIVLSNLGVRDHVIIGKQRVMVNDYEQAMTDPAVAVRKLRNHIDMNQTTLAMAGMVLDGFMESREPFIMSLLQLWRASTIKNLKEKARIAIEDGAFVLGCVDETAILKGHFDDPQSKDGATCEEKLAKLPEIFLQVDDTSSNKKGHYKIVEGVCVLARNPSLHPGDLRIVRAVDVPELHHLKNVVVLPQTGDRDLANMCSGGDLDGDDYMVLWDQDLIPQTVNVPPMDFTAEKPIEKDEPITIADIGEFFVTYMQNDSLGQIAHAHLAQADFNAEGVMSPVCLELAKLHSQAVDYPKSGIPAKMSKDLRPRKWPHFMEKKHMREDKIYRSTNVLGKLYDEVKLVDFKPQWKNPFDTRILDAFELEQATLDKAAEIKHSYDESLKRLMAKHGIQTEFEAWTVFVLVHNHESRDYKFAEEFGRTIGALKAHFKETCREAAGAASWVALAPFVAAMYKVTALEMEAALAECRSKKTVGGQEVPARLMDPEHMPLISFPWLFASELGKIATGSSTTRQVDPLLPVLPRRTKNEMKDHVAQIGDVETEEGVTHVGEILKLNFGRRISKEQEIKNSKTEAMEETSSEGKSQKKSSEGKSHKEKSAEVDSVKNKSSENQSGDKAKDFEQKVAVLQLPTAHRSASLSPPVIEAYAWRQEKRRTSDPTDVSRQGSRFQEEQGKYSEDSDGRVAAM